MNKKVALVTGGSTGIGAAITKQLAIDGFHVVITGRTEKTLKQSATQHKNISYIVADVSKPTDVQKAIKNVKDTHGRLDILINNAGIAPSLPFEQVTLEHFDTIYNTNVRGLVDITVNAIPLLKASKGNIVNISSVAGDKPLPGISIYSSTKGAINTLTKVLAKELAPYGIRVNAVSPGPIETPIFDKMGMTKEEIDHMANAISQTVPLKRFGSAEEVAGVVSYLASDKASYVTGSQYYVDGGYGA
ncbi:MAG: SDR family oxidoreductase [Gammaproteobacteria bacterium]|nr:SDR family oxidoreductase [Gammaproteobacteria bacterium]